MDKKLGDLAGKQGFWGAKRGKIWQSRKSKEKANQRLAEYDDL